MSATFSLRAELHTNQQPPEKSGFERWLEHFSRPFQYRPLDRQTSSIRLIRLLSETSAGGHVQCKIKRATIEASYVCLSYVWGGDDERYTILIDGKPFKVRHNLYRFLTRARRIKHLTRAWIWIDALCINQNDSSERNHQVQQMGAIFSRAKNVVSWLGDDDNIAEFLEYMRPRTMSEECAKDKKPPTSGHPESGSGFHHLCVAEYWDRAWITQELGLAREITLMAAKIELDGSLFPVLPGSESYPRRLELLRQSITMDWKGRSLIYLMNRFKLKEAHICRDRVYSLLALCGEGKDLQVDYKATDLTVAKHILRCCKKSFCLCATNLVAFILQLKSPDPSDVAWNDRLPPFATMTLPIVSEDFLRASCFSESYHSCYRSCNGTQQSHLPGFVVVSPSPKLLSIYLYLGRICESYEYTFVKLDEVAHVPGFAGRWSRVRARQLEPTVFTVRPYDCSLRLTNDKESYKARFSFDFLVKLAQLDRDYRSELCARVADVGTKSASSHDGPAMRMLSHRSRHTRVD